jgi:hypothetical protein
MSLRPRSRALLVACSGIAAGAGACWDFDSLSDGRADAGIDAPLPGTDSGASGDAADAGFCVSLQPKPLFCEDFDRTALPGQFTEQHNTSGSETLDPTSYVSAPHSLLAQYMALPLNGALNVVLREKFALKGLPTTLTFDLFLQPVKADTSMANALSVVASVDYFDAANNRYAMQFSQMVNAGAVNLRFEEQSQPAGMGTTQTNHTLAGTLPMNQWTEVRLVVTGGRAQITYGGVFQADVALTNPIATPTTLQLSLGSSFETTPSQGWAMRYDNVTLDATP